MPRICGTAYKECRLAALEHSYEGVPIKDLDCDDLLAVIGGLLWQLENRINDNREVLGAWQECIEARKSRGFFGRIFG